MGIIYDLIFLFVSLWYLPIYLIRGKFHRGFFLRLGFLPKHLALHRPIWIHAVSVGEAIMVRPLVEALRQSYPEKQFVISTVTSTGNRIAKSCARGNDLVTYLPLDFSFIVRRVIEKINPAIVIIAETELWPNLILGLKEKNIPVVLINGRISDASFRGYRAIRFLLKPFLNKLTAFLVQSQRDKERFLAMGAPAEKIRVTGNVKFDSASLHQTQEDYSHYRNKLKLLPEEKLIIAASTHPGEEKIVLKAYKGISSRSPGLRMLIAPRHPQRAKEIARIAVKYGFDPIFISTLAPSPLTLHPSCLAGSPHGEAVGRRAPVFILDTVGQLMNYYAIAEIVFMGGSLVKKGGHNILEPAIFARPILFGPHMFNFRDIAELFLEGHAAILVRYQEELGIKIQFLLNNPSLARQLGDKAKELVFKNQGAIARNMEVLRSIINSP